MSPPPPIEYFLCPSGSRLPAPIGIETKPLGRREKSKAVKTELAKKNSVKKIINE
jgi:hypothetical protein